MQANSPTHNVPTQRPHAGPIQIAGRAIILAAAAGAAFWGFATRQLWSQGGYLHLAFAQSLAADRGFGAGGRMVFGEQSPLWIALLAGCHQLLASFTQDWLVGGKVVAVFAALFFAAGLYRFTQGLVAAADSRTRLLMPAIAVLVVVLSPYWGPHAFSGTEVLAASGVACWGCALVAGRLTTSIRPRHLLAACLCAGCGPLLRPEMLFFSVCLAPVLFVRWANTPLRFGRRVLVFFTGLALAVAPGAGWLLYTVRKFGTALPNAIVAGTARPGNSVLGQGLARLSIGAPWLLVALAGAGWLLGRRFTARHQASTTTGAAAQTPSGFPAKLDPGAWIPLAWALLTALYYLATHTAITPQEVLLLAPACTASVFAVASLGWPRFAGLAGAACAVYGLAAGLLFSWPAVRVERQRERVFADLAATVRALPPYSKVALAPVGEVLFLSAHPVADLGGVLDPSASPFRWDATDARRVWWAHEQGARFLLLDHSPEPGSTAVWVSDLPADPWGNGSAGVHTFDRVTLWRLPPSPTLPAPIALPDDGS